MNEQFNPFRTVPRDEVESSHTFRSLRHFPEIAKSLPNATNCINTRTLEASALSKTRGLKKSKSVKASTSLKSTHYLDVLCKSSLNEFSTLSQFRKQIINDREKPMSHTSTDAGRYRRSKSRPDANSPLETGNAKLTKFAIRHDSRRANNDLEGFDGHTLSKEEFDYQLKRCLTIYLTREELDAVFLHMDTDNSQYIDGVEFLRYFFKLGQAARDRMRADTIATAAKTQAMLEKSEAQELQRSVEENCKYRIEFSEADMRGGMKKLRHFAATFPCTLDCVEFRDISSSLSPLEFRIVLEKLTSVRFSDAEIAALLDKYGDEVPPKLVKHGVWCRVDGALLVKTFIELRRSEGVRRREKDMANSLVHEKVQMTLGGGVDLFPKCLGR